MKPAREKTRKSFFGITPGIGPFTRKDRMQDRIDLCNPPVQKRRSFFGIARGVGKFTKKDEIK